MRFGYGQVSTMPAPQAGSPMTARPYTGDMPVFASGGEGGGGGGEATQAPPQDPYGPGGVTPPEGSTPPPNNGSAPAPGPGPSPGPAVPPNGTMPPPGPGPSNGMVTMSEVLRQNATKVMLAGGVVLLTGVVIGYFVGKGSA